MAPFLSFCVPTYNREKYLPDLLRSLVSQYDEQVEIVIIDNGSEDGTEALVREWQSSYPRIVYERLGENKGPDRSFLRSVEKASGSYCWLFGDDDILEEGALQRVLTALKGDVAGITVNRVAYDHSLNRRWMEPSYGRKEDRLFLSEDEAILFLFELFGFLSAQIVKRSLWLSIASEKETENYFNAYSLVYILSKMIEKEPKWLYLHTPCVGWRSGNDSFAKELGRHGRLVLDVEGYTKIVAALSSSSLQRRVLNRVVCLHIAGHVQDLRFRQEGKTLQTLILCLRKFYFLPSFWYRVFPLFLPLSLLRLARPLYRKVRRVQEQKILFVDV